MTEQAEVRSELKEFNSNYILILFVLVNQIEETSRLRLLTCLDVRML